MSDILSTHLVGGSLSVYGKRVFFDKPSEEIRQAWFREVQKEFGERFELSGPFLRAETRDAGFAHHYTLYAQGKQKMTPHPITEKNKHLYDTMMSRDFCNGYHPNADAEIHSTMPTRLKLTREHKLAADKLNQYDIKKP